MHKLAQYLHRLVLLTFVPRKLRWLIQALAIFAVLAYLSLYGVVGIYAHALLKNPPTQKADVALILGNRAYLNNQPNPCLTGRVDAGLMLAQQGLVSLLMMSGGLDHEDNLIEAQVMQTYAKSKGFNGQILLEPTSSSTLENLEFSRPILEAANVKRVIIVSEPYHMWRVKKLVDVGHIGDHFNVTYAAAPSQCWLTWGMLFKVALREPLAIINNYSKGYFDE